MSDQIVIDTTLNQPHNQLNSLLVSQSQSPGPLMAQPVNPEDAALRDKRAFYELLVRAGFFLPKLSSKFINQRMLMLIRDAKVFVPKQAQVVFRVCATPPSKQVMIDKYVAYCASNSLEHGVNAKAQNFPDKEYLVLAIATLSGGNDEIFGRNYYPLTKQPRVNTPTPFTITNTDGLLTNIPPHLLGGKGRSIKLSVFTAEEKMQVKMMRAEEAIRKHQANKSKIEKEIQAQKITKALFNDAKNFDAAQEREKIKAALVVELQTQANEFIANREQELQAEFQRQLQLQQQMSGMAGDQMEEESLRGGKQTKRRPGSKMAPFPNTVRNSDSMNDNTFE